jgi:putative SOS response-associated peptidase YedK
MCYSAEVVANYRKYLRLFGADIDLQTFYDLYWRKAMESPRPRTPKAMDAAFAQPGNEHEREIQALIAQADAAESTRLEQELFKQRRRLADAERTLQTRTTVKAQEDQRIAGSKIEAALAKLADLRRTDLVPDDSRIFPGYYVPVMVMEHGRRVVKPMRYQCRVAGKPAFYDAKFPGTYNARRDSLERFWKPLFGRSHAVVVLNAFYENVKRHAMEGRALRPGEAEENVVLKFDPQPRHDMLVACLWSRWQAPGEPELLSFAAITDEPPPEIAAAGHDRCIVPIKPEHLDAWLSPDPRDLAASYAILDDRERPYYEHRIAA